MNTQALKLIDNGTATGASMTWRGGKGSFMVHCDTWNGATVKLQVQVPGAAGSANWVDAGAETTLVADGGGNFELPAGQIRAAVITAVPAGAYATAASTL